MNNFLDKLQEAWQSQCSQPIDVRPDQLLKRARLGRLAQLYVDIGIIVFFFSLGIYSLGWAFRDIQKDWYWLFYPAGLDWVVGYMLFDRWRRRKNVAHYDDPLIAHVESSIKDIEHQMRLDRSSAWWYILPIALGCMLPPAFLFALNIGKQPPFVRLISFLGSEFTFAITFLFIYISMKFLVRIANESRRQELQALRALRDSLLSTDEPLAPDESAS